MEEEVEEQENSSLEHQHRKERRELQARITALRHSINKNDKKRKKEVAAEIAALEAEMKAKHEAELEHYASGSGYFLPSASSSKVEHSVEQIAAEVPQKRLSKAQKRREKKETEEKARNKLIEEEEKLARGGVRHKELEAVDSILKERNLQIYEVPADGDCLFNALSHQLSLLGITVDCQELRFRTSECMRKHKDDFLPFMTNEDTGDLLTDEQFERHCDKIAKPTVWGGQPEIRAFSLSYEVPVEVLQANAPPMVIGEEFRNKSSSSLVLTYHRHAFRLGEHYNSTVSISTNEDDEFDDIN